MLLNYTSGFTGLVKARIRTLVGNGHLFKTFQSFRIRYEWWCRILENWSHLRQFVLCCLRSESEREHVQSSNRGRGSGFCKVAWKYWLSRRIWSFSSVIAENSTPGPRHDGVYFRQMNPSLGNSSEDDDDVTLLLLLNKMVLSSCSHSDLKICGTYE